jgi:hypothetical protein
VAVASIVGFIGHAGVVYAAQDVVITITGDKLVGEIIRVEKDVLTFSTGYSDVDFKIEWDKVASIESNRQFLVETFDGKRLSGSLTPDPNTKGAVQVEGTSVLLADVSAVQPFERSFWSRFDSGLDFGYSMTRANSAKQLSLGTNLSYRDEQHADSLFANVFRNSQENAPETQRWEIGNDFRRLLGTRWYVNTTQDFLNTEEQGLDLRTTIGGGGGRYLMRSSSQHLALGGGLAWTNENYLEPTLPTTSAWIAVHGSAPPMSARAAANTTVTPRATSAGPAIAVASSRGAEPMDGTRAALPGGEKCRSASQILSKPKVSAWLASVNTTSNASRCVWPSR